jgi:SAM-dependent methyltransferase
MVSVTSRRDARVEAAAMAGEAGIALGAERLSGAEAYLEISDRERRGDGPRRRLAELVGLGWVRPGAHVVDIGAGQGWHALELTPWYEVTAVEPCGRLVRAGRARSLDLERAPRFARAWAQDVPLPERRADLVISLNTVLGYRSREDDLRALAEMRRILRPGAAAVVELAASAAADEAEERTRAFADGTRLLRRPRFDRGDGLLEETETVVLPDGRWGSFGYRVRLYDPSELLVLARDAGFGTAMLAGPDGRRWRDGDPLVLVAR